MRRDWPGEVPRDRMLSNFRPDLSLATKAAQARAKRAKKRAEREGNDVEHLALIRQLPCCLCENTVGIQAHHLIGGAARKHRGIGMKAPDRLAVPLCAFPVGTCHEELHARGSRHEEATFDAKGMNAQRIADALYAATGNLAQMRRIILAHKLSGSLVLLGRKRASGSRKA